MTKPIAIILMMILASYLSLYGETAEVGDLDQTDVWKGMSPDQRFQAAVRRWPSDDWEAFSDRDDDDFRIAITDWSKAGEGKIYAKWECSVGQRIPAQIGWSPDSKFLVITTRNAGGHHPAKCTSFVFCVTDRSFRIIDSVEGDIGDTKFEFVGPNEIRMNHLNDNMDGDIPFTFFLSKEYLKMKTAK